MAAAVKSGVESVLNRLSLGGDSAPEVHAPSDEAVKELKQKFADVEQDHVFAFFDDLTTAEKAALFQQLSNMNPKRISVSGPTMFALDIGSFLFPLPLHVY